MYIIILAINCHSQRRSCIYAVTPWRAHRQVKKKNPFFIKCIVTFNSLIKSV